MRGGHHGPFRIKGVSGRASVGAIWVDKKGSNVFTRPLAGITRCWHGIPFLTPEVVLLV
jgi:hypothetical protein